LLYESQITGTRIKGGKKLTSQRESDRLRPSNSALSNRHKPDSREKLSH
jgi:hypothetical protein